MDRRKFITGAIGVAALTPAEASANIGPPQLRGTIDANAEGLVPGSSEDQSDTLSALIRDAARNDRPLFIPPGRYIVANLVLPARTRLAGVAGATRLVFGGDGHMVVADNADIIALDGLVFDGADRPLADYVPALVHIARTRSVSIENCEIVASAKTGLALDRVGGRVTRTTISEAREVGLRAIECAGLAIEGNSVSDCGSGGILVWRWSEGEDGTIVTGNRVERIRADGGGTGENGNGISLFRAHGVIVGGNQIADCAFTAIRANSADTVQIVGNRCRGAGEIGILGEFSLSGALIANNVIEKAATGISLSSFREGGRMAVVSGNIVRDLTGSGPYPAGPPGFGVGIIVEADAALSGNMVENAPVFGMMLGWGADLRDVAATGNVIRGSPVGVAVSVVEGAGSVVISDNLIAGADRGAIVGMRWGEAASGDLARSGAEEFPHLMIERNRLS